MAGYGNMQGSLVRVSHRLPVYLGDIFERAQMTDAYRQALTATVLTYNAAAKEAGEDPLALRKLSNLGAAVLGGEIGSHVGTRSKDSVWWVTVNPNTGSPAAYTWVADDLSKWRRQLNAQLKAWDQKSAVKQLSTKRLEVAGVIAAVVVAVVVITVLTVGVGTAPAAGGGGGIGAGALSSLQPALKAIGKVAQVGGSLEQQAQAGKQALPPQAEAQVEHDAQATTAQVSTDIATSSPADVPPPAPSTLAVVAPYLAVGAALVALIAILSVTMVGEAPRR
jgi:hypothetical protein